MPPNSFVKCSCGILPGYLPRHDLPNICDADAYQFFGATADKHATFLISHQEEDTALLFLLKKCEVSERHVACPQELLGFKPGTSILLVHNSLVQNEKSRESCARCIRHPKAALLRTSSHVSISNLKLYYHMMLNHITLNYSVSFCIIM